MDKKSLISLMFFFQATINDVSLVIAQKSGPRQQSYKCSSANFKSPDIQLQYRDSAFKLHLQNFSKDDEYTGYEIGYHWTDSYQVWTASLCPPTIKWKDCWDCINNTIPYLKKNCPKQKLGIAWTVFPNLNCMVRYEDYKSQLTLLQWASTSFSSPSNQTVANGIDLEKGVTNLSNNLKATAASGGIITKFGSGHVPYGPGSRTLYGAMQCTPDISEADCMKCLSDATNAIHKCCVKERKLYGITMSPNCYFWYSHQKTLSN